MEIVPMKVSTLGRLAFMVVFSVVAAGCANPLKHMQQRMDGLEDAQLKTALQNHVAAVGGLEAWSQVERIEGNVLANLIEADGGRLIVEQQHHLEGMNRPEISILSYESAGNVLERVKSDGTAEIMQVDNSKTVPLNDAAAVAGAKVKLQLLGHALTGGAGLLRQDYMLTYLGKERKGGRLLDKIEAVKPIKKGDPAAPNQAETVVFWIDGKTFLVDRIWMSYAKSGGQKGYLGVKLSDYRSLDNGLVLPNKIEYLGSDAIQQFSENQIYLIEYQDLRVTKE